MAMSATTKTESGGPGQQNRKIGLVDVVSDFDIELDLPLADAWPVVFDYPSWQAYVERTLVAGRAGEEGEVFLIGKAEDEFAGQRKYCRTIKLDPPRQVIWKVYTEPGGGDWDYQWSAYVEYRLSEAAGGTKTRFQFQAIKEFFIPYSDESELAAAKDHEYKVQKEIERLNFERLAALLRN